MKKKTEIHDQTCEELEETIITLTRKIYEYRTTERELRRKLARAEERLDRVSRKVMRVIEE